MIAAIATSRLIIFIPARGKSSTAQIPSRVQPKYKPIRRPTATCLKIQQRAEGLIFMFFVASNQSPSRRLSRNVAGGHAPPLGQGLHPSGNQSPRFRPQILRFVDDSDATVQAISGAASLASAAQCLGCP
jgi:hypothetical protein